MKCWYGRYNCWSIGFGLFLGTNILAANLGVTIDKQVAGINKYAV